MYPAHDGAVCQELVAQLSDYVDGELEADLCAAIEAHLAGCPNCRVIVDTVQKVIRLYRAEAARELPSDVEDRLLRVLSLE